MYDVRNILARNNAIGRGAYASTTGAGVVEELFDEDGFSYKELLQEYSGNQNKSFKRQSDNNRNRQQDNNHSQSLNLRPYSKRNTASASELLNGLALKNNAYIQTIGTAASLSNTKLSSSESNAKSEDMSTNKVVSKVDTLSPDSDVYFKDVTVLRSAPSEVNRENWLAGYAGKATLVSTAEVDGVQWATIKTGSGKLAYVHADELSAANPLVTATGSRDKRNVDIGTMLGVKNTVKLYKDTDEQRDYSGDYGDETGLEVLERKIKNGEEWVKVKTYSNDVGWCKAEQLCPLEEKLHTINNPSGDGYKLNLNVGAIPRSIIPSDLNVDADGNIECKISAAYLKNSVNAHVFYDESGIAHGTKGAEAFDLSEFNNTEIVGTAGFTPDGWVNFKLSDGRTITINMADLDTSIEAEKTGNTKDIKDLIINNRPDLSGPNYLMLGPIEKGSLIEVSEYSTTKADFAGNVSPAENGLDIVVPVKDNNGKEYNVPLKLKVDEYDDGYILRLNVTKEEMGDEDGNKFRVDFDRGIRDYTLVSFDKNGHFDNKAISLSMYVRYGESSDYQKIGLDFSKLNILGQTSTDIDVNTNGKIKNATQDDNLTKEHTVEDTDDEKIKNVQKEVNDIKGEGLDDSKKSNISEIYHINEGKKVEYNLDKNMEINDDVKIYMSVRDMFDETVDIYIPIKKVSENTWRVEKIQPEIQRYVSPVHIDVVTEGDEDAYIKFDENGKVIENEKVYLRLQNEGVYGNKYIELDFSKTTETRGKTTGKVSTPLSELSSRIEIIENGKIYIGKEEITKLKKDRIFSFIDVSLGENDEYVEYNDDGIIRREFTLSNIPHSAYVPENTIIYEKNMDGQLVEIAHTIYSGIVTRNLDGKIELRGDVKAYADGLIINQHEETTIELNGSLDSYYAEVHGGKTVIKTKNDDWSLTIEGGEIEKIKIRDSKYNNKRLVDVIKKIDKENKFPQIQSFEKIMNTNESFTFNVSDKWSMGEIYVGSESDDIAVNGFVVDGKYHVNDISFLGDNGSATITNGNLLVEVARTEYAEIDGTVKVDVKNRLMTINAEDSVKAKTIYENITVNTKGGNNKISVEGKSNTINTTSGTNTINVKGENAHINCGNGKDIIGVTKSANTMISNFNPDVDKIKFNPNVELKVEKMGQSVVVKATDDKSNNFIVSFLGFQSVDKIQEMVNVHNANLYYDKLERELSEKIGTMFKEEVEPQYDAMKGMVTIDQFIRGADKNVPKEVLNKYKDYIADCLIDTQVSTDDITNIANLAPKLTKIFGSTEDIVVGDYIISPVSVSFAKNGIFTADVSKKGSKITTLYMDLTDNKSVATAMKIFIEAAQKTSESALNTAIKEYLTEVDGLLGTNIGKAYDIGKGVIDLLYGQEQEKTKFNKMIASFKEEKLRELIRATFGKDTLKTIDSLKEAKNNVEAGINFSKADEWKSLTSMFANVEKMIAKLG